MATVPIGIDVREVRAHWRAPSNVRTILSDNDDAVDYFIASKQRT